MIETNKFLMHGNPEKLDTGEFQVKQAGGAMWKYTIKRIDEKIASLEWKRDNLDQDDLKSDDLREREPAERQKNFYENLISELKALKKKTEAMK